METNEQTVKTNSRKTAAKKTTAEQPNKQEVIKVVVLPYRLNVRSEPSTNADIIYVLEQGKTLEVFDQASDFYKIKNNDGYIKCEFVKTIK